MAPEVVVLDGYVLGSWSELWSLGNCDTAIIIFPDSALEYWFPVDQAKSLGYLLHKSHKRNDFPHGS